MTKLNIPHNATHEKAIKMIEKDLNLIHLDCYYTQLSSLPDLPNLTQLYCCNRCHNLFLLPAKVRLYATCISKYY